TAAPQELGHKRPAATHETIMGDGEYHCVRRLKRVDAGEVNAIFAFDFAWISKRIMHLYRQSIRAQLIDDVGDSGISGIGTIFFKTDAEDGDCRGPILALEQAADAFARDAQPDAVVDLAAGQDDLRLVAGLLGPICQIIRVDANAVTANQARREFLEIPFRGGRCQHVTRINTDAVE